MQIQQQRQKIADLINEIKEVSQRAKNSQEKAVQERQTKWKTVRSNLFEIELLGGFKIAGYPSWGKFCEELGLVDTYLATELACARYEIVVFEVPVCTYGAGFFKNSRFMVEYPIRNRVGKVGRFEYADELIVRAKAKWQEAKSIASLRGKELPEKDDMLKAMGKPISLSPLQSAAFEIERLSAENEQLRKQIAIAELEYKRKLGAAGTRIQMLDLSSIQESAAWKTLVMQGVEPLHRYLNVLVKRQTKRAS